MSQSNRVHVVWPISKSVKLERSIELIVRTFTEQFPKALLDNVVYTGSQELSGLNCAAINADKMTNNPIIFVFDEKVERGYIKLLFFLYV